MTVPSSTAPPDGRAVANKLLQLAREAGTDLTLMQMLKILFFAHGIKLAVREAPLLEDRAQAWQYGPVFPRVYKAFSAAGRSAIRGPAVDKKTGRPYDATLDDQDLDILRGSVDAYGKMSAFKLSEISHAAGSPWDITFREQGVYKEIPNDLIRDYYARIIRRAEAGVAEPPTS